MKRNKYKKGDWLCLCDRCGFTYYASQLKQEWNGLRVCPKDFEVRHPQDIIKTFSDTQTVPWTRPESPDIFVTEVVLGNLNTMTGAVVANAVSTSTNSANIINVYASNSNTSNIPFGTARYNTITNTYEHFDYVSEGDGHPDALATIPYLRVGETFIIG